VVKERAHEGYKWSCEEVKKEEYNHCGKSYGKEDDETCEEIFFH
jgi:hypothetical protein